MHILKNNSIIIFFVILFIFSCKPGGPRSPEEAHSYLKSAYLNADTEKIESLLSERSKEKIKTIIAVFSSMNESQLKALSLKFNINVSRLKNMTIKDYLYMQISQAGKKDILREIIDQSIIGIDIKNTRAIARFENGMEVSFVKEGNYWKFDMEELSSKD